jgi:hypothetical protein
LLWPGIQECSIAFLPAEPIGNYLSSENEMKFIKKLFLKSSELKAVPDKCIYQLFSFNLKFIPDFSYDKFCDQVSKSGRICTLYVKKLGQLECGLFSSIEVKVYEHFDHKSISLINTDVDTICPVALERLVKACYECYGPDDSYLSRGSFDESDKIAIQQKQWSGRMWTNAHHKPGAMISLDREKLEMIIWLKDPLQP